MSYRVNVEINILRQLINTSSVLKEISKDLRNVVHERFRTSTAPDGSLWAGVTYRTGKPLWITGSLARSFKRYHNKDRALISTDDIRARIHNYGGVIKAKNKEYLTFKIGDKWVKVKQVKIKARPFAGFNQAMTDKYKQMIDEHYQREMTKKFGGVK